MLGGEIRMGSTVLLREAPGTGKTTLALQILNNHLKDKSTDEVFGTFFSLESKAGDVIGYDNEKYKFAIPVKLVKSDDGKRMVVVERSDVVSKLKDMLQGLQEGEVVLSDTVGKCIGEIIKDELGDRKFGFVLGASPMFIVIDSLNVFANLIQEVFRGKEGAWNYDMRAILQSISAGVKSELNWAVVLFTGEYDSTISDAASVAAESFFCDIDIQLSVEAVLGGVGRAQRNIMGLGNAEDYGFAGSREGVEKRFFCRVLKARQGARQTRRCAYDFATGYGLKFYETYPGDGHIMLFAENAPQRSEWQNFITQDILQMFLYPALDFNIFDRSDLQRTFASLRRFLYIPERTNMHLSSFDSYWISWYVDLGRRWMLRRLLTGKDIPCNKESHPLFYRILGKVHEGYNKYLLKVNDPKIRKSGTEIELDLEGIVGEIAQDICEDCKDYKNCKDCSGLEKILVSAYVILSGMEDKGGFLHRMRREKLQLFGECNWQIIKEIRKQMKNNPEDSDTIDAVPYNANISFIVYRKDLVHFLKGGIDKADLSLAIKNTFLTIKNAEMEAEKWQSEKEVVGNKVGSPEVSRQEINKVADENKIEQVCNELAENFCKKIDYLPQTWEEIIALCQVGSKPANKKMNFLIETRTYASFMCVLLEFIWNCGGNLHISRTYQVTNKEDTKRKLFQAFYLLYLMFEKGIIPRNCSLEAKDFAAQAFRSDSDWLFARHWYSTFVDTLTAKKSSQSGTDDFMWKPDVFVELDIMPIPISLSMFIDQEKNNGDDKQLKHVSSWGEWYFGVMKGTENESLAVDLINNMLSKQKVCDQAFACASLPTVEAFYEMYGDSGCFNLPDRESKLLPKKTYNDLRKMLFENGRSRNEVFDYQHCIRELHCVFEYVRTSTTVTPRDLIERIVQAIKRIEALEKKEMLLA
jgi:hypothetical protein